MTGSRPPLEASTGSPSTPAALSFTPPFHGKAKSTFGQNPQRVQGDPDSVSDPRQWPPFRADAGQHVERVPEEEPVAQA